MGLSAFSACAQQPPQPVRAGPTYPLLNAIVKSLDFGSVKNWSLLIDSVKGSCAYSASWEWPGMGIIDVMGRPPVDYCEHNSRSLVGIERKVSSELLTVRWTDDLRKSHTAVFDVRLLLGQRTPYGGGALVLEFSGPRVNLYLDEPDFSKETPTKYAPLVRHLLATSE